MTKKIYVIYDRLAETILGNPLLLENDQVAIRSIKSFMAQQEAPEEYALWEIGEIDLKHGSINGESLKPRDVYVPLPKRPGSPSSGSSEA